MAVIVANIRVVAIVSEAKWSEHYSRPVSFMFDQFEFRIVSSLPHTSQRK
jgi:hypothetical protein